MQGEDEIIAEDVHHAAGGDYADRNLTKGREENYDGEMPDGTIGVLLIVTPVFVVHFWMAGTYDQKIFQQDFEALAPEAAKFMSKKMIFANMLISMLPLLFIITETAGIALLIWGCYKWHIAQKDLDRSSELGGRGVEHRFHIEIEYIEESALKRNGRKRMPDLMVSPYILACPYTNR